MEETSISSEFSLRSPAADFISPVGYSTNPPPTDRPVRIFVHGVYDLFHTGFLEIAKNTFPNTYLIVGVTTDIDTIRVKGLTVISAADRAEVVRGCKYVDEVIQDCPPVLLPKFMDEYSIDYFAHADGAPGKPDVYGFVKEEGKFLVIPRIREWGSTTEILSRIIRDRNQYVARQLKNGASRKDMNVTWFQIVRIKIWLYFHPGPG